VPRAPARGGPAPLRLSFQILDLQVTVRAEHPGVAETLRMLEQSAHHRFAPARSVEYVVAAGGEGFDVREDGSLIATVPYPIDVLMLLDGHVYAPALAPHAGGAAALLHGACVRVGGTRALLVGERDARWSALLVKLLLDGAAVEGDWYVLLDGGLVTTVARTLRLQEEVPDALPEAAALVAGRPFVQDALGRVVWSFDPAAAGFAWEIGTEPVEAIVVVESNPGGRSRLERRPRYETAQDVVAAVGALPGDRSGAGLAGARVAAAVALVDACSCRRLRLGDLDEASQLLQRSLSRD
jgi:hypothetical protein